MQPRQRVHVEPAHDPGLHVRGRAQVEGHAPGGQLPAQRQVVDGPGAVGDPLGIHRERAAHLCAAAPLPGVERDPQAARPRRREGGRVDRGIGEGGLGSGEVPAGQALVAEADGGLGQDEVRGRVMGAQRGADEPDHGPGPGRPGGGAGADRRDPLGERQAAGDVEQGSPADLDVADAIGRLRLHELAGDPLQRLGVLHEGDRQFEGLEQLRLVDARHRRDQGPRHAGPVAWGVDGARAREGQRGPDAQRPVEVQVELGLRHRLDQAAERLAGQARGTFLGRGRHPLMLRFRAHVHHPGHGRGRVRRQLDHPGPAPRRPSRHRDGAHPRCRGARARAPPGGLARPRRAAHRRCHDAAVARPGHGAGRGRRPPRGDPARPQRRRGAVPGQYRRDAERGRGHVGGRDPAVHPHGRVGRPGRPDAPLRELEGEGRGARARIGPRLDDPQAVATVRGGGRLLQHRGRPGPPVTRDRPGPGQRPEPVPADPRRRRRAGRRPLPRGPDDLGRGVRARRAAALDVPGDHPGGRPGAREAPPDRADAGAADLAGRGHVGASPPAVPGRHRPAPPAAPRQHRSRRCHRAALRLRAAADGGRPRLPAGEAARPAHPWRPRRTARTAGPIDGSAGSPA